MSYIKLDRKLLDWEWFTDATTSHLWIYILLKANHKAKTWQGVDVPEGSFISSESKMSAETGLSREQIRHSIKKLISTNEITKIATKSYTQIYVNKWGQYQCSVESVTNNVTNEAPHSVTNGITHSITTTKEYKNTRSKELNIYSALDGRSDAFIKAFMEFADMRKRIKKPLTERTVNKTLRDLSKLSSNEDEQIQILDQSSYNYWRGVFPLGHTSSRTEEKSASERYKVGW